MNKEFNITQELAKMAEITSKTGEIFDLQALQVKLWGYVAFEYLGKGGWEAKIDADTKTVSYELLKKKRYPKDLAQKIFMLETSITTLFETFSTKDTWTLKISQNKEVLYKTQRLGVLHG